MKVWMTTEEAARHLRVSRRTLYDWRASLGLPFFVVGGQMRYERGEVDRWIEESRHQPKRLVGLPNRQVRKR